MPNQNEKQTNKQQNQDNGFHGGRVSQKPKKLGAAFKQLLNHVRPYYLVLVIAIAFAIGSSILNVLGPDILSGITDILEEDMKAAGPNLGIPGAHIDIRLDEITVIIIKLASIYVIAALCNLVQGIIIARTTQRITKDLRQDIFDKIDHLPLKYFDQTSYGDTLSRMTNDVDLIGQTMNNSITQLATAVTLVIGITVMIFTINVALAIVMLLIIPISMIFIQIIMKNSQKYFRGQQKALGLLNGHIEETYSGQQVLKVYQAEDEFLEAFDKTNQELYGNAWKSQFLSGLMMPITRFIGNLGYVAIAVIGGVFAVGGTMTFGNIQALLMYNRRISQPISTIAQSLTQIQSALAASERVFTFLNEEEMSSEDATGHVADVKGAVEFKHVKFGYEPNKTIIHDFSLKVKPGQKVAIVGPTGAGKTTLVNLVMRFYDIESGQILIDGVDTSKMTRHDVHQLFAMVLQDTWLFQGTIRDNLKYGRLDATDEEVISSAKTANVHHFIKSQPYGYDMVLSENSSISQGQKQLLTIARAMVSNAPMLILDEATSSVDVRTEQLIQDAMDELMKGRTTFVIAHRLSTIKNADIILVLKDGNIVETGNHESLLAQNGFYADLYNSQFEV